MALQCLERYGDARSFMQQFTPAHQSVYCATPELRRRCYMGTAPTLACIAEAYGRNDADLWLAIQIRDIANFSGVKEKLTAEQYQGIADTIKVNYGWLKVTELMLFFSQFKGGNYGRFYGSVDCMVITDALHEFCRERYDIVERYRVEDERAARAERERAEQAAREETAKYDAHLLETYGVGYVEALNYAIDHRLSDFETAAAALRAERAAKINACAAQTTEQTTSSSPNEKTA